ncbi:hypothetical protein Taro_051612 [Colocasia esculenta]|uniref:Uncharacterized protein n=1 Tax=Colocasia esculenta TaxID=4460 RepID=A0A843XHJ2_COLES|nr:hypothetical protein [Colocasia esculenta]
MNETCTLKIARVPLDSGEWVSLYLDARFSAHSASFRYIAVSRHFRSITAPLPCKAGIKEGQSSKVRLLPLGRLRSRKTKNPSLHPLKKKATTAVSRSRRRRCLRRVHVEASRRSLCRVIRYAFSFIFPFQGWAQRAHKFSICERDRGWRRVLNATALGVAFWLPPRSGLRLHVRRVSRVGRPADVNHGKVTAFSVTFRSRRYVSSVLGTLTPVFELYVRTYWAPASLVFPVSHFRELGSLALLCGCGAAVGPFIRDYEIERLVEVLPVVVCPGGGTILVIDPWWYLMVVGVEVDWCSAELILVLLPYVGRLPVKLVASATSCCNDLPVRLVA